MDELVCVKTYGKIEEAEVARMVLESEGIEVAIFRDDCGGWRHYLSFSTAIRLMVNSSDLERAREILEHRSN